MTAQAGVSWSSLLLTVFMVWGLVGNVLVCLAIYTDKRLQNVTNQFLFSLAVADLLVSVLVMPFSIMIEFHNGIWIGSGPLCTFYVYVDIFLCSASIVHMSIISLDRYMGIRYPLKPRNQSKGVVALKILIVWVITICITSPIAGLAGMDERNVFQDHHCQVFNGGFIIYGSTLAFLIPLLIMVVTYVKTTGLLREQALSLGHNSRKRSGSEAEPGLRRSTTLKRTNRNVRGQSCVESTDRNSTCHAESISRRASCVSELGSPLLSAHRQSSPKLAAKRLSISAKEPIAVLGQPGQVAVTSAHDRSRLSSYMSDRGRSGTYTSHVGEAVPYSLKCDRLDVQQADRQCDSDNKFLKSFGQKWTKAKRKLPQFASRDSSTVHDVANEQKATRVLGIVFLCFFICWTPFFTLNFLQAFCHFRFISLWKKCSAPGWVATLTLWLGYISSTINPVIYTIFNRRFRQTFKHLLACRCFAACCRSAAALPHQLTLTTANGTVHSLYSAAGGAASRHDSARRNHSPNENAAMLPQLADEQNALLLVDRYPRM